MRSAAVASARGVCDVTGRRVTGCYYVTDDKPVPLTNFESICRLPAHRRRRKGESPLLSRCRSARASLWLIFFAHTHLWMARRLARSRRTLLPVTAAAAAFPVTTVTTWPFSALRQYARGEQRVKKKRNRARRTLLNTGARARAPPPPAHTHKYIRVTPSPLTLHSYSYIILVITIMCNTIIMYLVLNIIIKGGH